MRLTSSSVAKGVAAIVASAAVVATMAATIPARAIPISTSGGVTASTAAKPDLSSPVTKAGDGKYIVRLAARAVASYNGGIPGLAPTTKNGVPTARVSSSAVADYTAYLDSLRASVLKAVPGVRPIYTYNTAFAGFAASLTYAQAETLARTPGVAAVTPNQIFKAETTRTPTFLGLDKVPGGLWDQLGGPEGAGEGIVVGDLDTGFSPDSGSFQPLAEPAPIPAGWTGTCQSGDPTDMGGGKADGSTGIGDQPAAITCTDGVVNNKVIGARYYTGGSTPLPQEFLSPRDLNGHGSHTGSTAAGNYAVPVTIGGADLGLMSGMAPRARLAVYKICWQQLDASASCSTLDSIAAIDQAVSDGVNVINYSIGGAQDTAADPVALAFMNAAAAGVFVSASAGNDGTLGSSAHNYPWVTTVAASTVDRDFQVTVKTGDGDSYIGAGIATAVPETGAVYAGDIPADGQLPEDAARCFKDSIDPAKAAGKIVVCDRGVNPRVEKSLVVKDAGGVGMVLANDAMSGTSTVTERHSVPTAHVSWQIGTAIKAYIEKAGADATLSLSDYNLIVGEDVEAPAIASFSSKGPGKVANGNLMKPDITAPGVSIIASLAPYDDNFGETYGFASGTSMSAPHVAGIAALEMALHPDWTPMQVKSALETSAYQKDNQGNPIQRGFIDATPLDYGAGHVDPNAAAATPLVYSTDLDNWIQFLCGTELPDGLGEPYPSCADAGGAIDPSDLNMPSIAVNELAGSREVSRTVTNMTAADITATASVTNPEGYKVTVTPSTIVVPAGGEATFTVKIELGDARLDQWAFGSYTLTAGDSVMRSPIEVRAVTFKAAEILVGKGTEGSVSDTTAAGQDMKVSVNVTGLAPAQFDEKVLRNPTGASFPTDDPKANEHVMEATVEVPDGTSIARFALFKEDYVAGTDLDMFVYIEEADGSLTFVKSSATSVANEVVSLDLPPAGTYHVFIDLYALAKGETQVDAKLYSFVMGSGTSVGDFSVEPDQWTAESGSTQEVTFSWKGLTPPAGSSLAAASTQRYLGIADYVSGETALARTLVQVDVEAEATPTNTPTETVTPTITETPTGTNTPTATGTLPHTGAGGATTKIGLIGLLALIIGAAVVFFARRRLRTNE